MRKPPNETPRARSAYARAQVHPERRACRPGRADPPRARPGRRRSRRTCARARRAAAPGSGSTAPTLEAAQAKGKLKGALARAFKTGDVDRPRRSRRADRGGAAPGGARPARAGGARRQSAPRLREDRGRRPARRRSRCCSTPPTPARKAGASSTRPGASGSRRREAAAQGLVFPVDRAILSLALGRENVVHVAIIDRAAAARVSHALGRWRAFIGL